MSGSATRMVLALVVVAIAALLVARIFFTGAEEQGAPAGPATGESIAARDVAAQPPPDDRADPGPTSVAEEVRESASSREASPLVVGPGDGGLSGVVLDGDGHGVEGAKVRLLIGPKSLALNLPVQRRRTDRETSTESDGTFTIDGIPPGDRYVVQVEHPDFALAERSGIVVRENDITLLPDIVLNHGARVLGKVTAAGGTPIAGARVELWNSLEANLKPLEEREPWKVTTTEPDGTYEFDNVHFNALEVVVSAPGYATASRSSTVIFAQARDRELNFELGTATSLAGVVVDTEGRPIAQAQVEAYQVAQGFDKGMSRGRAVTDAGGRFTIAGLAEGNYNVTARKRGYSDTNLGVTPAGTTDARIVMMARGAISGKVVDARNGSPVTSFRIRVLRRFGDRPPAPTGKQRSFRSADGTFLFDDLDPASYVVEAEAKGYAPGRSDEVGVQRGQATAPVVVRLGQGATVTGTVVDTAGNPIAGARVRLNPNGFVANPILDIFSAFPNTPKPREWSARTGEDGRFTIERVVPDVYQVEASHPRYSRRAMNDVRLRPDETTDMGRIVLSAGGSVLGTCVEATGKPFSEGTVHLQGVEGTDTEGVYREVHPDYDGRFEFTNLPPGDYVLSVQPDKLLGKAINPLMRIFYAKETQQSLRVREGVASQVKLTLPPPKQG